MERWTGKIAVVTGCSAGIGAQIGADLVKSGLIVVGLARRVERIEELKQTLPENLRGNLHALKCDVSKEKEIVVTFAEIEKMFGGVDLLVNNAGIALKMQMTDADNSEKVREILDTNVLSVVFCTREAVRSMKQRGDNGSIININSVVGHSVPFIPDLSLNIYPASKYAVTAITELLRLELIAHNSKIRVTSISPGRVRSEIRSAEEQQNLVILLEPEDISQAVLYVISTPERVQIHELTIKPLGEKF